MNTLLMNLYRFGCHVEQREAEDAKPVVIFHRFEGGRLMLNKDGLRKVLDRPELANLDVAILAIVGEFRMGKSFFLNLLMKYFKSGGVTGWMDSAERVSGFEWRGGQEGVGDAIVMWSEPLVVTRTDGSRLAILLVDTPGIDNLLYAEADNANVFTLTTLISSILIYNVNKHIVQGDLNYLQFAAQRAVATARRDENGQQQMIQIQKVLFLLRDFRSSPREGFTFGLEGGKKYIDYVLDTGGHRAEQNRQNRQTLAAGIKEMSCCTLPNPGPTVDQMEDADISYSDIGQSFTAVVRSCLPKLFALAPSTGSDNLGTSANDNTEATDDSPDEANKVVPKKDCLGNNVAFGDLFALIEQYSAAFEVANGEVRFTDAELDSLATLSVIRSSAHRKYVSEMKVKCGGLVPFLFTGEIPENLEEQLPDDNRQQMKEFLSLKTWHDRCESVAIEDFNRGVQVLLLPRAMVDGAINQLKSEIVAEHKIFEARNTKVLIATGVVAGVTGVTAGGAAVVAFPGLVTVIAEAAPQGPAAVMAAIIAYARVR